MYSLHIVQGSCDKNQLCFFVFHVIFLFWLHFIILPLSCFKTEQSGGCSLADLWTRQVESLPATRARTPSLLLLQAENCCSRTEHRPLPNCIFFLFVRKKLSKGNLFFLSPSLLVFFLCYVCINVTQSSSRFNSVFFHFTHVTTVIVCRVQVLVKRGRPGLNTA